MNTRSGILVLVCAVLWLNGKWSVADDADVTDTSKTHAAAIASRLETLQNVVVVYNRTTTYSPYVTAEVEEMIRQAQEDLAEQFRVVGGVEILRGTYSRHEEFRFLRGLMRRHGTGKVLSEGEAQPPLVDMESGNKESLDIWIGDGHWILAYPYGGGISGTIQPPVGPLPETGPDYGLGLRAIAGTQWLQPSEVQASEIVPDVDGTVRRVVATPGEAQLIWVHDPARGYALLRHQVSDAQGRIHSVVEASDFIEVKGLFLPKSIQYRSYSHEAPGSPVVAFNNKLVVERYELNDSANRAEIYQMRWPTEARVHDVRTDTWMRGDGSTIEVRQEASTRRENQATSASLSVGTVLIAVGVLVLALSAWYRFRHATQG